MLATQIRLNRCCGRLGKSKIQLIIQGKTNETDFLHNIRAEEGKKVLVAVEVVT